MKEAKKHYKQAIKHSEKKDHLLKQNYNKLLVLERKCNKKFKDIDNTAEETLLKNFDQANGSHLNKRKKTTSDKMGGVGREGSWAYNYSFQRPSPPLISIQHGDFLLEKCSMNNLWNFLKFKYKTCYV